MKVFFCEISISLKICQIIIRLIDRLEASFNRKLAINIPSWKFSSRFVLVCDLDAVFSIASPENRKRTKKKISWLSLMTYHVGYWRLLRRHFIISNARFKTCSCNASLFISPFEDDLVHTNKVNFALGALLFERKSIILIG